MDDPLRLSGCAGCVQYVQNILGVHWLRRTIIVGLLHEIMPPIITAFHKFSLRSLTYTVDDDHVFHAWAVFQSGINILLQWHESPASIGTVRCYYNPGLRIIDSPC